MTEKRLKILITNDDGITAQGIWHLWHALHDYADLFIVAPNIQKSGVGLGLTLHKPLTIHPVAWEGKTPAWRISGTPADCVRFGISVLLEDPPDLVVSGINHGSNAGRNVLYSGTMGGAIEAGMRNILGIAFSSTEFDTPRFESIEPYIYPIVAHFIQNPMTEGTVLNVNFPTKYEAFKGVKLARQGQGRWVEDPDHRITPVGEPYYWHGGKWAHHEEHIESDVALLEQGFITVVPIHINELTDHSFFKERKVDFDLHFENNPIAHTRY